MGIEINNTTAGFSRAAHVLAKDSAPVDWFSAGPVNVVFQDNQLIDLHLGGQLPGLLTIDTRAGLIGFNNQTIPMQWSNGHEEISTFINRAGRTASFGTGGVSELIDVRHTGNSTFVRFGEKLDDGILVTKTGSGKYGVAVYGDGVGIRSAEIDVPAPTRKLNYDNVLTYAAV